MSNLKIPYQHWTKWHFLNKQKLLSTSVMSASKHVSVESCWPAIGCLISLDSLVGIFLSPRQSFLFRWKKKERNELQFDILLMLLHYVHLNQEINQRPTNPLVFSKRKVNLYVHRKTNQLLCLDWNFSNIFLYPQHGK